MKYYIDNGVGDLVQRHWCDNPDCPNWCVRGTVLAMQIRSRDGHREFCNVHCEKQWFVKEEKERRRRLRERNVGG